MAWKAALLVAAVALAALPSPAEAAPAGTARLVALAASYGPEGWKDTPPIGRVLGQLGTAPPAAALGVYENPYASGQPHQGLRTWLGYNLTASIEIDDGTGKVDPNPAYSIGARIDTGAGSIPGMLARTGPGQFLAQFDLDGENGRSIPAAFPGAVRLVVQVNQTSVDPTLAPTPVSVAEFPLTITTAVLDRPGMPIDEGMLPGYGDVGSGNQTLLEARITPPAEELRLTAAFGVPNASAAIVAWDGPQPHVLASGNTDEGGFLRASARASELVANGSGLIVVEAHLTGSAPAFASVTMALVVSSHPTRVVEYAFEPRNLQGQGITAADAVRIVIEDPTAGEQRPVRGSLHAVDRSGRLLADGAFDPATFGPAGTTRVGRLLVASLPSALSSYRLVAFLESQDNRVYSMASAMRGYALAGATGTGLELEQGTFPVFVRNLNDNGDDRPDAGLALTVRLRVAGQPGLPVETDVHVDEAQESRVDVRYAGAPGTYAILANSSSAELRQDLRGALTIQAPNKGFLGLPGAEPIALIALLGGAALAQRRRTSR